MVFCAIAAAGLAATGAPIAYTVMLAVLATTAAFDIVEIARQSDAASQADPAHQVGLMHTCSDARGSG
jgi:hypothetical protein